MKPTLSTRDTLRLMLFALDGRALCLAGYTGWDGAYHALRGAASGSPWEALGEALRGTLFVGASHCLVVSNVGEVVGAISPALRLDLAAGEADAHWSAISLLSVRYGGHCAGLLAEQMPKTEDAWRRYYSN